MESQHLSHYVTKLPHLKNIKYIILFQQGGLGNQFFQYYTARLIAPDASIICIGYHDLQSVLGCEVVCSDPLLHYRIVRRLFAKLGISFSCFSADSLHLIGRISESTDSSSPLIRISRGLLPGFFLQTGYYQDSHLFASVNPSQCPLRQDLLSAARQWLNDHILSKGAHPYFLHIRRGDYVRWPSVELPAVLPLRWYVSQMELLRSHDPLAQFIVFSDDIPYAHEFLSSYSFVSLYSGSLHEDFVLMTQCFGGGILSASTFSWWASWYGRHFSSTAKYLAPNYWAGWRRHDWYPPRIAAPWVEYVDVI